MGLGVSGLFTLSPQAIHLALVLDLLKDRMPDHVARTREKTTNRGTQEDPRRPS